MKLTIVTKNIIKQKKNIFYRFLEKQSFMRKKAFLAIFYNFLDCAKNPFRGFSLNVAKICQKDSSKI